MRAVFGLILLLFSATVQPQELAQHNEKQKEQSPLAENVLSTPKTKKQANEKHEYFVNQKETASYFDTTSLEKTIRDSFKEASEKPDLYANEKLESDKKLVEYTERLASYTKWLVLATFLAVLVALFLPFYQDRKKNKNILALLKKELDDNYSLLVKTEVFKDQVVNNQKILAIDMKIALAEYVRFKTWDEFKYNLAVYDLKEYEKCKILYDFLAQIIDYVRAFQVGKEPHKTMAVQHMGSEISSFISKYNETH